MSKEPVWPGELPRVHADEAARLVVHHLAIAAAYYESTPHDNDGVVIAELKRVFEEEGAPAFEAALAWLRAIFLAYEKLFDEYGDGSEDDDE